MNYIQLEFDFFEEDLYISKTCSECKNECKIRCITKDANIYCNRYKKSS